MLLVGMLANELGEVQSVVKSSDQIPHPIHGLAVLGFPSPQTGFGRIVDIEGIGDRIACHLRRDQCEQNPRGVERVEKTKRIADQNPTVACGLAGFVRVLLHDAILANTFGPSDARLNTRTACDFFMEDFLRILRLAVLEQVIEVGNHTDTDHIVVKRDVPKPSLFPLRLNHDRAAGIQSRFSLCAFEVRPDGGLLQIRIPLAHVHPIDQHRRLPASIDDDLGVHDLGRPITALDLHPNDAVPLAFDVQNPGPFDHFDPMLPSILHQHMVELTSQDLPSLRAFVRIVLFEPKGLREFPVLVDELHAVLLGEVT